MSGVRQAPPLFSHGFDNHAGKGAVLTHGKEGSWAFEGLRESAKSLQQLGLLPRPVRGPHPHDANSPSGISSCSGFPGGSEGEASARNAGDLGSTPGSGRSPGEGNGNPLQYSNASADAGEEGRARGSFRLRKQSFGNTGKDSDVTHRADDPRTHTESRSLHETHSGRGEKTQACQVEK